MNGELSQKRFAFGVTALTISVIIVKIIGLVYKIPLLHILGAEGMGYFNAAYEIYALFFVMSTAGLPIAVSILVSENLALGKGRNADKVHKVSFALFAVVGVFGALVMGFGASWLAGFLETPKASFAIFAISPTILLVCIAGAMRGLFQGYQNMKPTAVSQVIEALGKLFLGLLFAWIAKRTGRDVEACAAYAALGITAGSFLSAVYLLFCRKLPCFACAGTLRLTETDPTGRILRRLMFLAIPVTLCSSLSGLTRVVDMSMIFRRLQSIGYESSVVAAMYGSYSTLAVPLYNLPSSLVAGISLSLVPVLTEAAEGARAKQGSALVKSSIKMCLFLSLPCSVGMAIFARPILSLLFAGEESAIVLASPLLTVLAFSVSSSCLMGVTNAILQAYRRATFPIFSMLAGTVVKILSAYILIGIPSIGMYGAAISTLLCNLVAVGMNLYFIDRITGVSYNILKLAMLPMLASFLSIGSGFLVWCILQQTSASSTGILVLSVVLCVVLYLWIGGQFGVYESQEVQMLPGGEKLLKVLNKFGCLKRKDGDYEQRGYDTRASQQREIRF